MPERTLSDQIADFLIAQIFVGALKAGDRLPPERRLAEILEVDRTSLRVALKILARMNLVESVQGSGVTVLDMREHGGLDVLDTVLHIPEVELGSELLIQAVRFFARALPLVFRRSIERLEFRKLLSVSAYFDIQLEQLKNGASRREIAESFIEFQDTLVRYFDQVLMVSAGNSSRRLRLILLDLFYEVIDLQAHLEAQIKMVQEFVTDSITIDEFEQQYRQHIESLVPELVKHLKTRPAESRLTRSPLKHLPDLLRIPEVRAANVCANTKRDQIWKHGLTQT
jgi:GntR family transcriptional repressor for pyruvate dehydrogenase complex